MNRVILGALMAMVGVRAVAYEQPTHRMLSSQALRNSVATSDVKFLMTLSLNSAMGFPDSAGVVRTLEQLVETGADLEDVGDRPRNHFFDPFYDRAIALPPRWTTVARQFGERSPDWILSGTGQNQTETISYQSAMDSFLNALTRNTVEERERAWGRVFEALGHVTHHIQDMAQPQHVRNDPHYVNEFLRSHFESLHLPFFEDRSWFEQYALDRPGSVATRLPRDRSTIRFARAKDFWTTPDGRGIADYTNNNFVSKDTNFEMQQGALRHAADYPKPVPGSRRTWPLDAPELGISNADDLCERLRSHPAAHRYPVARCEIDTIDSVVFDDYAGTFSLNERTASFSVFDEALREVDDRRGLMTLNSLNVEAAYSFLIPQAVNYSAGLIDHFFRGRLELAAADGDTRSLRIEIKNVSTEGNVFGPGTFTLHYDNIEGKRVPATIDAGAHLGMRQFAPGQTHVLTVRTPADVDLKADKPFVLAYSGVVGAEEAVSGLVFEAPQVYDGFLFRMNAHAADLAGFDRLIYYADGQWHLHPQGNVPRGGTVDWKGRYVDGKPTRVLTWTGASRYGLDSDTAFMPEIFRNGKLFVRAPGRVLGAALRREVDGSEWVVAICLVGDKDIAFKRPATRDPSAALYDPQSAPNGWRYLGEFRSPQDLKALWQPWLFNGDGTEAQTMRQRKLPDGAPGPGRMTRLKASVGTAAVQFTDLGNTEVTRTLRFRTDYECEGSPRSAHDSRRTEVSGEHVVMVDYQDRREILARLVVASLFEHTSSAATRAQRYDGTDTSTVADRWLLQVDETSFPLFEMSGAWRDDYSYYQEANGGWTVLFDKGRESAETRATLAFRDLRTGSFALGTHQVDVAETLNWRNDDYNLSTTVRGHYQRDLAHAGTWEVLNRTPTVGQPQLVSRQLDPWQNLTATLAFRCQNHDREPLEDDSGELRSEVVATLETLPTISVVPAEMRGIQTDVVAATDRNGNLFWSMIYRDGEKQPYQRVSRIGGVDVDSITGLGPITSAAPAYVQIVPN